jgi:hypothetical protein
LSNVVCVTTTDNFEPDEITTLSAATGDSTGEIVIEWTATGDDSDVGVASYYEIAYSQSPINEGNWDAAPKWPDPPIPLPAGMQQSCTLSGLQPGMRYYIAIKAVDEGSNKSGMSNPVEEEAKIEIVVDADDDPEELPSKFSLGQNYPNPFNPSTTIEYSLAQEDNVSLEVFNILGQHIVTLVDDILPAGEYQAIWNGVDKNGIPVSSGIYLYRIRAGMYIENKKMILMK